MTEVPMSSNSNSDGISGGGAGVARPVTAAIREGSNSNSNSNGDGSAEATAHPEVADSQSPPSLNAGQSSTGRSPKKRRKVNHACVYCRRSHMTCNDDRPCTRCVKRNIGHLCHDEPREPKKHKSEHHEKEDHITSPKASLTPPVNGMSNATPHNEGKPSSASVSLPPPPLPASRASGGQVSQNAVTAASRGNMNANSQAFLGVSDWDIPPPQQQSNFTNPYHQQWMFSAPEVSSEFNLLSDFLGNLYSEEFLDGGASTQGLFDNAMANQQIPAGAMEFTQQRLPPPSAPSNRGVGGTSSGSTALTNPRQAKQARDQYYLTAADPSKEIPEERMKQVLKAKQQAGLLKPFNYVNGYARLSQYMEKNMQPASRKKILSKLDEFRPKFRERTQSLTDLDLVHVEEWFEKSLLEYDRVFASMAVPACLWRRTGEIFRGNKEFAELINVPIEQMRDGKLAIYELIVEDSAVSYWQKFGTIAFDTSQKAMLTSCHLKNPDPNAAEKLIHCCFSFTIRRDSYDIPALIIGNFMPINPKKHPVSS
ncbi:hypothetical protein FPQ18DRAFT_368442 [Pyronema domesticum]|nr:hypothetical protein FPQ18DRAFT_368442 [Pyronema domesticum]